MQQAVAVCNGSLFPSKSQSQLLRAYFSKEKTKKKKDTYGICKVEIECS